MSNCILTEEHQSSLNAEREAEIDNFIINIFKRVEQLSEQSDRNEKNLLQFKKKFAFFLEKITSWIDNETSLIEGSTNKSFLVGENENEVEAIIE